MDGGRYSLAEALRKSKPVAKHLGISISKVGRKNMDDLDQLLLNNVGMPYREMIQKGYDKSASDTRDTRIRGSE